MTDTSFSNFIIFPKYSNGSLETGSSNYFFKNQLIAYFIHFQGNTTKWFLFNLLIVTQTVSENIKLQRFNTQTTT